MRHIRRAIALTLAAPGCGGGASRNPGAAPEPAQSSAMGVGTMSLQAWRDDMHDSTAMPLFVTFGEELPVASFAALIAGCADTSRIAQANARFRDESSAGWLTDHGRVLVALAEPDDESRSRRICSTRARSCWCGAITGRGSSSCSSIARGFGRWMLTPTSEAAVVRALHPTLAP